MNVDGLIRSYFNNDDKLSKIYVFDNESIYRVYSEIVNLLKNSPEIELGVLQSLSYCFYEILDNVLTHSNKLCGTVITRYVEEKSLIQILVADDGIGIRDSLAENKAYKDITEEEAIEKCIQDKVTDGKGMGFGLYSTSCLMRNAGVHFEIHSGSTKLVHNGENKIDTHADFWQGTIVYLELKSDKEINPDEVFDFRTNAQDQFNEMFLDADNSNDLW